MTTRTLAPAILCLAGLTLVTRASPAEQVLFDFTRPADAAWLRTQDAQVALVATRRAGPAGATPERTVDRAGRVSAPAMALRVMTGHREPWPGVTLSAPSGQWDLSPYQYLTLEVKNVGDERVAVHCRVDNPGADGKKNCLTGAVSLEPRQEAVLRMELKRAASSTLGGKLFGMRGYPVAPGGEGTIDPTRVNQLIVFVANPTVDHRFELGRVCATGTYAAPTAFTTDADPFFPFIDGFGQYRHKDWPGKMHSVAEMAARREAEAKELAEQPAPKDWDQYGGWLAGPRLQATGFFRTEKHAGKWWLVDPEGRLFFSHGIDCVRMQDLTPIDERAAWFADFPGDQPDLQEFIVPAAYALKGHYAGKSPKCFDFAGANLKRKYGPDWRESCADLIHRRLRSWGLNTIGMWSDEATRLRRKTPYVDAIGSRRARLIEGSEGYWGKFPDVFDPGFKEGLRRGAGAKVGKSAGDPWCLGYFADNEMSWGDETSLAIAALRSPPDQPAKRAFLEDLKNRYQDIGKLNEAWGTSHASWDALLNHREAPDKEKAKADLAAFYTRLAEQYFRTVREAIKDVAPQQLYLGCRFAWVNPRAAAAAAKYCDVVSYNLYRRSVADFQFNGGADVPLIIGEFHLGALDRGMFHTGLVPVASQAERAAAYQEYIEGALRHPAFVGCHWFQYQDEPTTGRVYDEENYQIGFIDIADTPYRETIEASRAVAAKLYSTRLAK